MSGPLHDALAELVLAYSQKVQEWTPYEIQLVQRCKAALEQSDAMDRQEFPQAQQEAEREAREESREDRERDPEKDWQGRPGYPRR